MYHEPSYHYFLIPGLGFNAQTFKYLKLYAAASITIIEWKEPKESESLDVYILRMAEEIPINLPNKILIGHSFGGVIAQEIGQLMDNVKKIILISSIKHPNEISWNLQVLRKLPLYKLVNHQLINLTFPIWAKLHDFHNEEERNTFSQMVNEMSLSYFNWAVNEIINWKGIAHAKIVPIHIHGDNDRTFYCHKINKPIIIKNGGHFMVFNKASEISEIIRNQLRASVIPIYQSSQLSE